MNDMLTAAQSSAFLGIPVRTFYDLAIPCYRYGRKCSRWARAEIEAYRHTARATRT